MVAFNEIQEFAYGLVRNFHPHRVVLFGSHASGQARDDSDVDILVTMDYQGNSLRTAAKIIRQLKPRFAVDLIVRTESELKTRIRQADTFLTEASTRGQVLYEASN